MRLAPVVLVAAWGVAWIAFHASEHAHMHTLFQTLALAESVVALLLRRRKPVGALVGILVVNARGARDDRQDFRKVDTIIRL